MKCILMLLEHQAGGLRKMSTLLRMIAFDGYLFPMDDLYYSRTYVFEVDQYMSPSIPYAL